MLQNARVTVLTVSELLRENQKGGSKITPTTNQIKVKGTKKNSRNVGNWTGEFYDFINSDTKDYADI